MGVAEDIAALRVKIAEFQAQIAEWLEELDRLGEIALDYRGPNYSMEEEEPPYLLVGAYFPSAVEAFSEVFEFSDLRVGNL